MQKFALSRDRRSDGQTSRSMRRTSSASTNTPLAHVTRHLRAGLLIGAAGLATAVASGSEDSEEAVEFVNPMRPSKPVVASESHVRSYFSSVMQNTTDLLALELGSLTDLGVVLVLFALTVLTVYTVPPVIDESLARFRVSGHVRTATRTVLQIGIAYAGLRLALGAIGVDANGIVASLGLITVAWSIGAATPIANATAGLFRTSEELQPGHRIAIHEYVGTVEELGFFNVRLRNEATGRLVVIPNNDFLQSCWEYAPLGPPPPSLDNDSTQLDSKNLGLLGRAKNK
jgi:hypothetical protein